MAEYKTYVPLVDTNENNLLDSSNAILKVVGVKTNDGIELELYKNRGEQIRVDKTDYLTSVGTLVGVFRGLISITATAIDIEYDTFPNFNYVHIPELNRWYYVTDITAEGYKRYTIHLSIDILMSYKDGIKGLQAFVERNEFTSDGLVVDTKRVAQQGIDITTEVIENKLFKGLGTIMATGFTTTVVPSVTTNYFFRIGKDTSRYYLIGADLCTFGEWITNRYYWNYSGAYLGEDGFVHLTDDIILYNDTGDAVLGASEIKGVTSYQIEANEPSLDDDAIYNVLNGVTYEWGFK